ncbi:hypothetical protein VH570_01455 [Sphingobium sp. HT1-2]|uniref:hypothetical protein n=1 Tax=Sphingobium sp. HT1-2 TaxID=3111640 RepID=UPI003C06BDAA
MTHKITGADLVEMRGMIAMCVGHAVLTHIEKPFIATMAAKAERAVMVVTPNQYQWMLAIINRVVDFDVRFVTKRSAAQSKPRQQ